MQKFLQVLVVDDSMAITARLKEILEQTPCVSNVFTASNTAEAEAIISKNEPHIILLDINMLGKNGVEYLKELKVKTPHLKVMMVTNQAIDYYRPLCLGLGADYFIDKSNEFDSISPIIEELCNSVPF